MESARGRKNRDKGKVSIKNNPDIYFCANIIYNISKKAGEINDEHREYCG